MTGAVERSEPRNSRNDRPYAGVSFAEQLGARLRQLRKQHGLTQKSIAEKLGISTPALCRWESGQTLPRKSNLQAFADVFDLTESELLAAVGANDDSFPVASLAEERAARRVGADLAIAETSRSSRAPGVQAKDCRGGRRHPGADQDCH